MAPKIGTERETPAPGSAPTPGRDSPRIAPGTSPAQAGPGRAGEAQAPEAVTASGSEGFTLAAVSGSGSEVRGPGKVPRTSEIQPRSWTIEMPPGEPIISANNRLNRYERNRITQDLKAKIGAIVRGKIPAIERADVTVTYVSPPRLRQMRHPLASDCILDSDNIAPTAKALADGLTKAGVFRTDSKKCVRKVTYILSPETHPRGLIRITITEVTP